MIIYIYEYIYKCFHIDKIICEYKLGCHARDALLS